MEIWSDIKEYERAYKISNLGNVLSVKRMWVSGKGAIRKKEDCLISPGYEEGKYLYVLLYKNGKRKKHTIHRLVALHFISNPENKREVNHKDGNKLNNKVENLEWNTSSENEFHAYKTGLKKAPKEENHYRSILTNVKVVEIKKLKGKLSQLEISKKFNVHKNIIQSIFSNKTWKNV